MRTRPDAWYPGTVGAPAEPEAGVRGDAAQVIGELSESQMAALRRLCRAERDLFKKHGD